MNRIKISPLATAIPGPQNSDAATPFSLDHFDKLRTRTDEDLSIFVPLHYEKNYAYPLVVWLHSNGDSSSQIQSVMPQASMRNFVGIAPQAPVGNFEAGHHWEEDSDAIESAHDSVMAAVDYAAMRFNIATRRIFIAGSRAGGTMAFRIGLERPDIFAGVISLNGPMPVNEKPLGQWSDCRELPVFWAHDRRSDHFQQDQLCEQLRLLHIAGFSVTLRQYPSQQCLHQKSLSDMNQWIMEMINSTVK